MGWFTNEQLRQLKKKGMIPADVNLSPEAAPRYDDHEEGTDLERAFDTQFKRLAADRQEPHRQVQFKNWTFDRCWPDERVVVELDGKDHLRWNHFHANRWKDAEAQCAGYLVFRFTTKMLEDQPDRCISLVTDALQQRTLDNGNS